MAPVVREASEGAGASPRPRVLVLLRRGLSPASWNARVQAGTTWEQTPYGYNKGEAYFEISWAKDHPESRVQKFLRKGLSRVLGFDLLHVWRNRALVRSTDVVWTHTEREYLALLLLKRLDRSLSAKVIAQSVWLWDRWSRLLPHQRMLAKALLPYADVEITLSEWNKAEAIQRVPGRRVEFCPFGTHGIGAGGVRRVRDCRHVIAVGNDMHRDWALLARVAALLPDLNFTVLSPSPLASAVEWPDNVSLEPASGIEALSRAYLSAGAVVVPLRPNLHASGATVVCESLSAGIPMVITDTGGIASYAEGPGVELVPPGDPAAMADAIRRAIATEEEIVKALPSRRINRGLTEEDYVARYAWITMELLGLARAPAEVFLFARPPSLPVGSLS